MNWIFNRTPGYKAAIFAEARALMDDGLDLEFVLGLFPEDAEWLRDELALSAELTRAYASQPASFVFEAALRERFLAAAEQPRTPAPAPSGRWTPVRTAVTSLTLATAAGAAGVVTLGFVTSGNAVPGDWNYSFKLAGERIQYALSRGQDRVNVQLGQAEARVYEIQVLSRHGDVSTADINRLKDEVQAIATLAQNKPLDDVQKARLQGVAQTSQVVLRDTRVKQPSLDAPVEAAGEAIHSAVVEALAATPVATATATPATTTATATATPAASQTPLPTTTTTQTPEPTASVTETPAGTASPTASTTPSPTATSESQQAGNSPGGPGPASPTP